MKPTQEECDKYLEDQIEQDEELKKFWNQDEDIRDYYGLNRDPLFYLPNNTVNQRWRVVKKIEIMQEYIVEECVKQAPGGPPPRQFLMAVYKS